MSRDISTHAINPANEAISILVLDEIGPGGANHDYLIDAAIGEADGRAAYEAYAGSTGWKSAISGAPLPAWDAQDPKVRRAWCAAAEAPRRSPRILFQNGPVRENGEGVNGITHEALLAIIIDRLQAFQNGPYACRENALALTKLEEAKLWMFQRTLGRMARGVEGTHAK